MSPSQAGFIALALVASLLWGVAPVFGKAGLGSTDPNTALLVRTLGIALVLTVYALGTGGFARLATIGWRPAGFILAEGILASLAGHLAFYYALKLGEAGRVVPIAASYPLVTVLIAMVFLGEAVTWQKLAGTLLVVAGVWLLKG